MVLLAVGEWARFGRQVVVYSTDQPPRTEQQGVREREAHIRSPTWGARSDGRWATKAAPGRRARSTMRST